MNITLVNTWRVIDSKGGTEKVFCDMANELSRRGYDVTAICHDPKIGVPGFPLSTNIHFVNAFKKPSYFDKKSFIKIRALHFKEALQNPHL